MSTSKISSVEAVSAAMLNEAPVKGRIRRARGTGGVRYDARRQLHIATWPREGMSPKTVYGKTQAEALEKLEAWKREVATGRVSEGVRVESDLGRNPTLGAWVGKWMEDEVKPVYNPETGEREGGMQPTTYQTYAWVTRSHILPYVIADVRMDKMTVSHVEQWWKQLRAKGVKMPSAHKALMVLQGCIKAAIARGDVTSLMANPAGLYASNRKVRRPQTIKQGEAPEPAQVVAVYAAAAGERLELVLHLGIRLGLRRQELTALRFGDFDFEREVLHIRRRVNRVNIDGQDRIMVRGGVKMKDEAKEATVPLKNPERWKQLLAEHKVKLEAFALVHRKAWTVDWPATSQWGYLFPTRTGQCMDPNEVFRWYKGIVASAGYPELTVHDMRHWCASIGISNGMSLWEVSKLMRHSSTNVTESVYGHIQGAAERAIYSIVDDQIDAYLAGSAAAGDAATG